MSDRDYHVTLDDLDDRMAGIEVMLEELKTFLSRSQVWISIEDPRFVHDPIKTKEWKL